MEDDRIKDNYERFQIFAMGLRDRTDLSSEEKIKLFIDRVEEIARAPLPKGVCVCEDKDGGCIMIPTKDTDDWRYEYFIGKMSEVIGNRGGASSGKLRSRCSGNYIKR